jgi:hypothetical protein
MKKESKMAVLRKQNEAMKKMIAELLSINAELEGRLKARDGATGGEAVSTLSEIPAVDGVANEEPSSGVLEAENARGSETEAQR